MMCGGIEGERGEDRGLMDPQDRQVGDGLRYHILDVWVDGLVEVEVWEVGVERGVMSPVKSLFTGAVTKTLRLRAQGVMEDERLRIALEDENVANCVDGDDEFEGFD